ncbi:MAG: phage integrase [Bryobacterales bacterium]|nr:phage integrase [Bryobacterales bacterium]
MSHTDCPFSSVAALRAHLQGCHVCAERATDVLSLAIQVVVSQTQGSVVYEQGVPRLFIIDPSQDALRVDAPVPTFRQFVESRYIPGSLTYLRPGAQKIYQFVLRRYVLPEIGVVPLTEVTFDMMQGLVAKMLGSGYSVQTAKHAKMVANRVFVHAERVGAFRGRLPTQGVRFPAMVRRAKTALTFEQARAVLAGLKTPYREMALMSMTTSMNAAELFAVKWSRLNLTSESVTCNGEVLPPESLAVRESYYEGAFGPPKTINRKRDIPLSSVLVVALQELKATSRFSGPEDLVFASRNGTPRLSSNVRHKVIKPLGKRLGIPWLNLHTFRYTYATLGEQLGISLSDRQAQMGHGAIWMTQEYTVSNIENRRAGSERLATKIA